MEKRAGVSALFFLAVKFSFVCLIMRLVHFLSHYETGFSQNETLKSQNETFFSHYETKNRYNLLFCKDLCMPYYIVV